MTSDADRSAIQRTDTTELADPAKQRDRSRKKGSRREERSVRRVRTAMAAMLERNAGKYDEWLTKMAADNPGKALVLMKDLAEYFMPKLGRVEQTGTVQHKVSHFVAVTEREKPPVLVQEVQKPAIDAEFTPVPDKVRA